VLMQRCLLVQRCWCRGAGAEVLVQRGGAEQVQRFRQRWCKCKGGAEVLQRCQCAKVWSRDVSITRRRRGGSSLGSQLLVFATTY
jgi:hypothetical protein